MINTEVIPRDRKSVAKIATKESNRLYSFAKEPNQYSIMCYDNIMHTKGVMATYISHLKNWGKSSQKTDSIRNNALLSELQKIQKRIDPIQEAIEEAKVLLDYQFDWDDNEGEPTDLKTLNTANTFLTSYSIALILSGSSLSVPYFDITPTGGISLKWENENAIFFIIFNKGNNDVAYFYGESKDESRPSKLKSGINPTGKLDGILLAWMKDYLSIK